MFVDVKVQRTEMCGGGTSYDVLWPKSAKSYRPIAAGCYATVISPSFERYGETQGYYRTGDFLRTADLDALPALTTERLNAFRAKERAADRFEARIAARAYSELSGIRAVPSFWINETYPSDVRTITVDMSRHAEILG